MFLLFFIYLMLHVFLTSFLVCAGICPAHTYMNIYVMAFGKALRQDLRCVFSSCFLVAVFHYMSFMFPLCFLYVSYCFPVTPSIGLQQSLLLFLGWCFPLSFLYVPLGSYTGVDE